MANDINAKDSRGRTALHHAVINKDHPSVAALLELGADHNIRDSQGRKGLTPMWYACCQNADPLSVMVLKNAGATVDQHMIDEMQRQKQAEPLNREKREIRTILGVS